MLIRVDHDTFAECPDDVAALILADPSGGEGLPEFSVDEINGLVHWVLGTFADTNLTWDENVKKVRDIYASLPNQNAGNLQAALAMVKDYNKTIEIGDVGNVDKNLFVAPDDNKTPVASCLPSSDSPR